MRERMAAQKEFMRPCRQRERAREDHPGERAAFKRIKWYLYASNRRMILERRITRLYGCKTSWPGILENAKYRNV